MKIEWVHPLFSFGSFKRGKQPTSAPPLPSFRHRSEVILKVPFFPEWLRTTFERGMRSEWQEWEMGMTVNPRSFDPPFSPFGLPLPKSVGRFSLVPVIPWNDDLVSFHLVLKRNDPATTDIFIFGSFHCKSFVMPWYIKWHENDRKMMLEWGV